MSRYRIAPLVTVSLVVVLFGTLSRTGRAQEKTEPPSGDKAAATSLNAEKELITPALVFVADGAGGHLNMSKHLKEVIDHNGYALQVVTYDWSHGASRYIADHLAYERSRREGVKMAALIQAYRRENPDITIHAVGHSAGTAVLLSALESLPPGCVDEAFIISPSVSADYDLRPALKSVKEKLYVHYSSRDWFWMGVATRVAGTTDRRWGPSSGRIGFRVDAADPDCRAKLVQRNWEPGDSVTGNTGGHFGGYESGYLHQAVVPLMLPTAKKDSPRPMVGQGN